MVRTTRGLERTGTGRPLEGLHRRRRRSVLRRGEVDETLALSDGARRRQLAGGAREQCLDLVRRQVRTLLEEQRRGAGDDRRRLRRAAAAEEPLTGARAGRRRPAASRDPQADDGLTRSDDVGVAGASPVADHEGTMSSSVVAVPLPSEPPTAITYGS